VKPNPTINRTAAGWRWEVDADDSVYSGVRATREEAEAEGRRVAWEVWSTVPKIDPAAGLRADLAIAIARAEKAEATAARLNAANVRLMRRLGPALGAWKAAADELAKMGQRAVAAEAALATARAETGRLRAAIRAAARALPEWSKGALEHLSPAELVADDVRMALREALLPPVESA
jgi:hypothetical protein